MADWYVDPGLARFINQWKALHLGAVVYTIGDAGHAGTRSDHNPEVDGSVDACDVMPGAAVTEQELDDLAETLRLNRDPRIRYVIRRDRQFAGPAGPLPWDWREYGGDYHHHLHLSVGDAHEGKPVTDWDLTPPEGEGDMPTAQEIAAETWKQPAREYRDEADDGTRDTRTTKDILYATHGAADEARDLARAAADAVALLRQELDGLRALLLERLPAPPDPAT